MSFYWVNYNRKGKKVTLFRGWGGGDARESHVSHRARPRHMPLFLARALTSPFPSLSDLLVYLIIIGCYHLGPWKTEFGIYLELHLGFNRAVLSVRGNKASFQHLVHLTCQMHALKHRFYLYKKKSIGCWSGLLRSIVGLFINCLVNALQCLIEKMVW